MSIECPDYDDAFVEGVIHVFDDVLMNDLSVPELGDSPIPFEEGIRRYIKFLESFNIVPVDEDGLIAE